MLRSRATRSLTAVVWSTDLLRLFRRTRLLVPSGMEFVNAILTEGCAKRPLSNDRDSQLRRKKGNRRVKEVLSPRHLPPSRLDRRRPVECSSLLPIFRARYLLAGARRFECPGIEEIYTDEASGPESNTRSSRFSRASVSWSLAKVPS
jgi:hypothetical protein